MTQKIDVLIVEDDSDICELITLHLKRAGYQVDTVSNGDEAFRLLRTKIYHLVVMDWMLPGMSGLELVRAIRQQRTSEQTSILMVTAKAEASDVILGLEVGADDYVSKPFEPSVFMARVRALMRRQPMVEASAEGGGAVEPPKPGAKTLEVGLLSVREDFHEVRVEGVQVVLTPSEFKLLVALIHNQGKVLTRDRLIQLVQGEGVSVVDRAVDTHIFGLRKKLGVCSDYVETVRGVGYRIKMQD